MKKERSLLKNYGYEWFLVVEVLILFCYFFIVLTFLFNIIVSIAQAKRSYQLNHSESFYSLALSVGTLILSFIIILIFTIFDSLTSLIVIFCAGIVFLLFGIFNLIHFFFTRHKAPASKEDVDFSDRESLHHEFVRKIFHIVLFFGIIAMLVLGYVILRALYEQGAAIPDLEIMVNSYWGKNPNGLGMWLPEFEFGQGVLLLFFMLLTTIFTMNEGARLGKWYYFPLRKLASIGIREKEKETVASYVYFTIGMIFASTFLYPIPLFSIIGILSFADTAASLFGRRYGRHKLQFNKEKSWEGSLGGVLVCLLVTILLVGPIWGLAATLVFFVIDGVTPVLPISDNIGIPIGVTGVYLLLSALQIPMYSIVIFPFI